MAIFTTYKTGMSSPDYDVDMNMIEESPYEVGIRGALAHIAESEQNWNNIFEAIALDELNYFAEHGEEMVYESGKLTSFFAKVKSFFKKILEKITMIFKKFLAFLDSYTKSDKEFYEKYKKILTAKSTRDMTFKGFKYTIDNKLVESADTAISGEIDRYMETEHKLSREYGIEESKNNTSEEDNINNAKDGLAEEYDMMRAKAIDESSGLTQDEFIKELFSKFRDGDENPVEIDNIKIDTYLNEIRDSKTTKKEAENAYNTLKKSINTEIRKFEKIEKELGKLITATQATIKFKVVNIELSMTKEKLNILQTINGQVLSAIKQRNRQAKNVCVKLVGYTPKNESAYFDESSSYLDGVQLI